MSVLCFCTPQPLQSLSLADSKLKTELTIIINALGSNTSLTKVDISGNGMGDMGAKMLAKALQINTKLRYGQYLHCKHEILINFSIVCCVVWHIS